MYYSPICIFKLSLLCYLVCTRPLLTARERERVRERERERVFLRAQFESGATKVIAG
jgi:hypothetical protein